ncbi:exodeoxyribonuclease V subunit beta [Pedobacter sp. SD-b]|uniref:RecBCD enzyme subunit RecB n=1 Tax=Pedobacter segetis TaxID=2793069 RepID=A0ABS1BNW4_9SPHI|nr:exodeoxyribonuclease V subunit beta [Pedobacter segetis]MBK0384411.1 exodeoxyribonuclease V subunit beta [Pedobacter segetis]
MPEDLFTKQFKDFNASTVVLKGSNLIEASAGTGKTYSIAILVLRLIIEQKMPIQKILMVTFTKAAVAELEERIRKFVRLAHKVSKGENIDDKTITEMVKNHDITEVEKILDKAILFLDETSILTIHSFCQQTLNQFAFETQQLFGVDLLPDSQSIMADEVNRFWRKYITGISMELLNVLIQNGFSRDKISNIVKEHLAGKKYMLFDEKNLDYCLNENDYQTYLEEFKKLKNDYDLKYELLYNQLKNNAEELKNKCEANTYARKGFVQLFDDFDSLIIEINSKTDKGYVQKIFVDELEILRRVNDAKDAIQEIINKFISNLYCHAIQEIGNGINYYKTRYNQINYDDLISKLHKALHKENNEKLAICLQEKYRAVFIDEFQDTDKLQYEIFEKAFADKTILFYIGDPKQSIYAWRKADIFTYFKAKNAVDNLYGMNQNFRSSAGFINAMNVFFKPNENFDTFHFKGEPNSIDYIPVKSPINNTKGNLIFKNQVAVPISICQEPNGDELNKTVVAQIIDLLSNADYQIEVKGSKRTIKPQDIGILIRTKKQGKELKKVLSKYGIPSITIDDAKVLRSEEASYVSYLLQAFLNISISAINKALLSPFTQFTEEQILHLNDELIVEQFKKYKETWDKSGIYAALNQWIIDFNIINNLKYKADGERIITNLYQLIELLHKNQSKKNLNNLELISWLQRGIEGMQTEGDEYQQRIESDEDAVKIITIHASKGLEYNIVFAPYLDLSTDGNHIKNSSFRDEATGNYISAEKSQLNPQQLEEWKKQNEQENRRLIYVSITRAVYKCFIYKNTASYHSNSSLAYFINAIPKDENNLIETGVKPTLQEDYRYKTAIKTKPVGNFNPIKFYLDEKNWRRMSYSMLRADHPSQIKPKTKDADNDYDNFIFSTLRKGAKTGNMLHYIFENISFNDESKWESVILSAINRFVPNQTDVYAPMLFQMLKNVLNSPINIDGETFSLAQVNPYKCINEFEFDFNVHNFNPQSLSALALENQEIEIKIFNDIEGMMNGKIDLFFEHENKFYVLDWKSNFLGDSLDDYSPERLNDAMNQNNYHLQYLIYTLAAKKYIKSRIPSFYYDKDFGGVIYLFLRGMREGAESGIFTAKPSWKTLANMNYKLEGEFT